MTRSVAPATAFPVARILTWFARSLVSLVKAFKDRREVRNLEEFDERMLRDIGLTRGDVESALMEPIHHRPSWVLVRCAERPIPMRGPAAVRNPRPVVPFASRS
ncbi:DUF1127 domain-containing protein [Microvirga makkahensis]|uniref:DUF1127 domain-containing protein n=1 Tax=Microvirga makkahensis TaxID=1128670 RepID=A0A7X3SQU9_9HYPH|nr:DUF1127 domain-containing protein [Microvirga makkahensis]MXQ13653.1 DUF1127 domain-containing protein [Microvirga makkahensis]